MVSTHGENQLVATFLWNPCYYFWKEHDYRPSKCTLSSCAFVWRCLLCCTKVWKNVEILLSLHGPYQVWGKPTHLPQSCYLFFFLLDRFSFKRKSKTLLNTQQENLTIKFVIFSLAITPWWAIKEKL